MARPNPSLDEIVAQTIERAEHDIRRIESLPEEQQWEHAEDLRQARLHASLIKQAKERNDRIQNIVAGRLCGELSQEEIFETSDALADVLVLALECDDRKKSFI